MNYTKKQLDKIKYVSELKSFFTELISTGHSLRQIASHFNSREVPTWRGRSWNTRSVQDALEILKLQTVRQTKKKGDS